MTEEDDMVTLQDEERKVRELLSPLQSIESVPLPARRPVRRPLTRRPAFVAGVAAAVFAVGTGVAFANDVNPFSRIAAFVGLTAADGAQTSQDVLDPAIVAQLDSAEERVRPDRPLPVISRGEIVSDSTRFLKELPSGRSLYLATTTTDQLILILTDDGKLASAVGLPPLPARNPVTVAWIDDDLFGRGICCTPRFSYGIAQDGITAVSFMDQQGGSEQTVSVIDNVWAYEGRMRQQEVTAHYADGTTHTVTRLGGTCVMPSLREEDLTNDGVFNDGPVWCASAQTYLWYPDPDSFGANADTTSWVVEYFDPERAR
jgi:hypothetical protein